jgi:hypothetical protein
MVGQARSERKIQRMVLERGPESALTDILPLDRQIITSH